jgi:hypothetical protein
MLPKPGDLINIDKKTPGVIIAEKSNYNSKWGYMLCNLEPGQNALVLETYVPNSLSNSKSPKRSDMLLQAEQEKVCQKLSPTKRPPYKTIPEGVLILVVALGEHIVELVWNSECCSLVSL